MQPPSTAPAANPVPQQLVHKTVRSEVLLTSWKARSDDAYTVTARWPRTHSFYLSAAGLHDPLIFAETVRQTIPLLSHAAYDVPFGHRLIWETFEYRIEPEAMRTRHLPAEVVLNIRGCDITRRRGSLSALTLRVAAERDGVPLGFATARFTSHSPAVYRRLRRAYADTAQAVAAALPPGPAVPPGTVGRHRRDDVVLSATGADHQWALRVDPAHPVLFDHPVDHAPGMLLLEAARQAAHAAASDRAAPAVASAMDCTFLRYVELDAPCLIEAEPLRLSPQDSSRMSITARQHDAVCFAAQVQLAPAPLGPGAPTHPDTRLQTVSHG